MASARVFALTSPNPASTMPPQPPPTNDRPNAFQPDYPAKLSKTLNLSLFPLDVTTSHSLSRSQVRDHVDHLVKAGSPLAEWLSIVWKAVFKTVDHLYGTSGDHSTTALHDPVCLWYVLTRDAPQWMASPSSPEDIRVETTGQWTRGMCVVDRRGRVRQDVDDVPGDTGGWLSTRKGNRIKRIVASPGEDEFATYMLGRIFG